MSQRIRIIDDDDYDTSETSYSQATNTAGNAAHAAAAASRALAAVYASRSTTTTTVVKQQQPSTTTSTLPTSSTGINSPSPPSIPEYAVKQPKDISGLLSGSLKTTPKASSTVSTQQKQGTTTTTATTTAAPSAAATAAAKSAKANLLLNSLGVGSITNTNQSHMSSLLSSSTSPSASKSIQEATKNVTSLQASSSSVSSATRVIASDLPAAVTSFATVDALRAALARDISATADVNQAVRKASLQRIAITLFGRDVGAADDTASVVTLAYDALVVVGRSGSGSDSDGGKTTSSESSSSSSSTLSKNDDTISKSNTASSTTTTTHSVMETAAAALSSTSQIAGVLSSSQQQGMLPAMENLFSQTQLASLDPAYVYHAHELSPVAALIMGRAADGSKQRASTVAGIGPAIPSMAALTNGAEVAQSSSSTTSTTSALPAISATSLSLSLARAMAASPLPPLPTPEEELQRRTLLIGIWSDLSKPLLRRIADTHEPCRVTSLGLLAGFLSVIRDIGPVLPYLVPALVERAAGTWVFDPNQKVFAKDAETADAYYRGRVVASHQGVLAKEEGDVYVTRVAEASETVRMLLARLIFSVLATAIREGATSILEPYLHELIMCSHALAVDPSPDVRVVAAPLLLVLCDAAPHALKHYAVALVRSLMGGGLDHRHAKVRLATLDVVDALIIMEDEAKGRGAGSEALIHLAGGRDANTLSVSSFYVRDTSINYFAKLSIDAAASVRLRFVHALGGWLTRLGDRHEWWSRLLPYVLSAYADPCDPVVQASMTYLEACGVSHEAEHGKLILEKKQYGLDGDPDVDYDAPLPYPFSQQGNGRPRIGVRLFVRANCPRFVKPLLAELSDWSPFGIPGGIDVRARAASLLCTLLVYLEEYATQDVHALVNTLIASIHDSSNHGELSTIGSVNSGSSGTTGTSSGSNSSNSGSGVAKYMRMAARLMGRFLPPSAWLDVLIPIMTGEATAPKVHSVTGSADSFTEPDVVAACLHVLWLAAAECKPTRLLPQIPRLVGVLTQPQLVSLCTMVFPSDIDMASLAFSRRVYATLDTVRMVEDEMQRNKKYTSAAASVIHFQQQQQQQTQQGVWDDEEDNNNSGSSSGSSSSNNSTYSRSTIDQEAGKRNSMAGAALARIRNEGAGAGKGSASSSSSSSSSSSEMFTNNSNNNSGSGHHHHMNDMNLSSGASASPARYMARQHLLSCYTLLVTRMDGRLSSVEGAAFEKSGRLGQGGSPQVLLAALCKSALIMRGQIMSDAVDGRCVGWGAQLQQQQQQQTISSSSSSSSSLRVVSSWPIAPFTYKNIAYLQPVYEIVSPLGGDKKKKKANNSANMKGTVSSNGESAVGETEDTSKLVANATNLLALHGDMCDAVLVQLAKTASPYSGPTAAVRELGSPHATSSTSSSSCYTSLIPDLPPPFQDFLASRVSALFLQALGDYPADAGWKKTAQSHVLLSQYLSPFFVVHHPAIAGEVVSYMVDLGRSLTSAAHELAEISNNSNSNTNNTSNNSSGGATVAPLSRATSSSTSLAFGRKRGRYGFYSLAHQHGSTTTPIPRWVDALVEWCRLAMPVFTIVASSSSTSSFSSSASSPDAILSNSILLRDLVGSVLCFTTSITNTTMSDTTALTATDSKKKKNEIGFFASPAEFPHLFVLGCEVLRILTPVIAHTCSIIEKIHRNKKKEETFSEFEDVAQLVSSLITETFLPIAVNTYGKDNAQHEDDMANKQDMSSATFSTLLRSRAFSAITALLPIVALRNSNERLATEDVFGLNVSNDGKTPLLISNVLSSITMTSSSRLRIAAALLLQKWCELAPNVVATSSSFPSSSSSSSTSQEPQEHKVSSSSSSAAAAVAFENDPKMISWLRGIISSVLSTLSFLPSNEAGQLTDVGVSLASEQLDDTDVDERGIKEGRRAGGAGAGAPAGIDFSQLVPGPDGRVRFNVDGATGYGGDGAGMSDNSSSSSSTHSSSSSSPSLADTLLASLMAIVSLSPAIGMEEATRFLSNVHEAASDHVASSVANAIIDHATLLGMLLGSGGGQ